MREEKMKTLVEHEADFWADFWNRYAAQRKSLAGDGKCGISCPCCGKELSEDVTQIVQGYPSYPPQHAVVCGACDWRGSIH